MRRILGQNKTPHTHYLVCILFHNLNNKLSNWSPRWSAQLWVPLGTIPGTPACGCIPPADQNKFDMDPKTRDPKIRVLYFCIYNNIIYPGSTMRTRILVLAFGTMIGTGRITRRRANSDIGFLDKFDHVNKTASVVATATSVSVSKEKVGTKYDRLRHQQLIVTYFPTT